MKFSLWVNPQQQVIAYTEEFPDDDQRYLVYQNEGKTSTLQFTDLDHMELADELTQNDHERVSTIELTGGIEDLQRYLDNVVTDFRQSLKLAETIPQVGEVVGGVVGQMVDRYRQFESVSTVMPLPCIKLFIGAAKPSRYDFWEAA